MKKTNADNPEITWTGDNVSVAEVDATGKVTAIGVGKATISVALLMLTAQVRRQASSFDGQ